MTADQDTPATMRDEVAQFIDGLESRVDQFQGDGYTLDDEQLDENIPVVLTASSWRFNRGQPYEVQYDVSAAVGVGTNDETLLSERNPDPNGGMDTYLEIDGIALSGMRRYESTTQIQAEVKPVFNRDTAEKNEVIITNRAVQTIVFEGTHTGSQSQRASDDAALDNLLATETEINCKTKVPGYTLEGFVTGYDSTFNAGYGQNRHDYRVQFTEGVKSV